MENKQFHLQMIQTIISRMAGNSFFIKGWSVTLASAIFVLSAAHANVNLVYIAFFPVRVKPFAIRLPSHYPYGCGTKMPWHLRLPLLLSRPLSAPRDLLLLRL